ncbi:MAG: hypothetical protein U1E85_08620 [Rhodocyclaceae bacterium]
MDQKTQFIADYLRQTLDMTELCQMYGISRKTGYKWIGRYLEHVSPARSQHCSCAPSRHPNQTPEAVIEALIQVRQRHPTWGAKKLLTIVEKRHPDWELPGRSTVCEILNRHGLVPRKGDAESSAIQGSQRHRCWPPTTSVPTSRASSRPATAFTATHFTVTDGYSRYLLGCQASLDQFVLEAKPVFTRLFKEYAAYLIRSDNGVPFATTTLARR